MLFYIFFPGAHMAFIRKNQRNNNLREKPDTGCQGVHLLKAMCAPVKKM